MKFDISPQNITKEEMRILAESIEDYLVLLEECMIFPKEMKGLKSEKVKYSISVVKKLIKKLKKGDKSVFRDEDDEYY